MQPRALSSAESFGIGRLTALFLALNVADVIITYWLLDHGGYEINPLLSEVSNCPATKMMLACIFALLVVLWNRPHVMLALVIGMACVVVWNVAMAGALLLVW